MPGRKPKPLEILFTFPDHQFNLFNNLKQALLLDFLKSYGRNDLAINYILWRWMMAEFKKGDIVELKSGSPKMTVLNINETGWIRCQWFSGSKLQEGVFKSPSLIHVEESDDE